MESSPSDEGPVVRKEDEELVDELNGEKNPDSNEKNSDSVEETSHEEEMNSREFINEPKTQPSMLMKSSVKKKIITPADAQVWFARRGWSENPFRFSIEPDLMVGYIEQINKLMRVIEEKHKLVALIGPTGSGKTTMLKWVASSLSSDFDTLFLSKPPDTTGEFIEIFNEKYKRPWFMPFKPHIKNIYQLPDFLQKQLDSKHLVIMCDEVHEADREVLEWLRVLSDQVENLSLIVAGLPSFNEVIKAKLETFQKRIITQITLVSLTKKETAELIQKRISSVGGQNIQPFTDDIIDYIYDQTSGFPREVIRVCNDLVNMALESDIDTLTKEILQQEQEVIIEESSAEGAEERPPSLNMLDNMTPLQVKILKILAESDSSPGEIADTFDLGKYKSRQHAVRSVNNILIRMMADGFVRRVKKGRTFGYTLAPKVKTLMVRR